MVRVAIAVVVVLGLISGPWALDSGRASQPSLEWSAVWIVGVASAIAAMFVFGLQVLLRNPVGARRALWALGLAALYFAASGASAFGVALFQRTVDPGSVIILVIGVGAIAGVGIGIAVYRAAFAT